MFRRHNFFGIEDGGVRHTGCDRGDNIEISV